MLEAVGDLWTYPAAYRLVPTNGVVRQCASVVAANGCASPVYELVMGAGVALEAARCFPGLARTLGFHVHIRGNCPYPTGWGVISFPTKHHWRDKADLDLIRRSAEEVMLFPYQSFVLPRVGAGLGGLPWEDVRKLLAEILDNRFTVVHRSKS